MGGSFWRNGKARLLFCYWLRSRIRITQVELCEFLPGLLGEMGNAGLLDVAINKSQLAQLGYEYFGEVEASFIADGFMT